MQYKNVLYLLFGDTGIDSKMVVWNLKNNLGVQLKKCQTLSFGGIGQSGTNKASIGGFIVVCLT
jgi:hypothetical protein